MKRFLVVVGLALLGAALLWAADEVYTISLVNGSVVKLDLGRVQYDDDVCVGLGLAIGCSQSAACVARGLPSGCTAAEALAAGVRIFANTQAGREGFIKEQLIKGRLEAFVQEQTQRDRKKFRDWCETATPGQRDQVCADIGQAVGCYVCN